MHESEIVGSKLELRDTPALIAHSEDEFIPKCIRSSLPLRNDENNFQNMS